MSNIECGALTESLELLAETHGDPTPLIYAELFRRHPEHEGRFFMDLDGGVRGEMLSQALDVLMRADAEDRSADTLIEANRFAHFGYGITDVQFNGFFVMVRDVVRSALGNAWTPAFESRWKSVLERMDCAE